MSNSLLDLLLHLLSKYSKCISHISHSFGSNFSQNWSQFIQCRILGIVKPRRNLNPIVLVKLEVLRYIVNNDHLTQVSSDSRQVFDEHRPARKSMLSVKSMADEMVRVYLINHPISIILHRSCEYDYLIVFVHFFKKLANSWSDQAFTLVSGFEVMH